MGKDGCGQGFCGRTSFAYAVDFAALGNRRSILWQIFRQKPLRRWRLGRKAQQGEGEDPLLRLGGGEDSTVASACYLQNGLFLSSKAFFWQT